MIKSDDSDEFIEETEEGTHWINFPIKSGTMEKICYTYPQVGADLELLRKQINIMDVKDDEIPKYNIINLQTLKAHWMRALKCGCLSSKLL